VSAGFDVAAVLLCVRALLPDVADATCALVLALAAFGFAAAFCVAAALLPAVIDVPVSVDVLALAAADLLLSVAVLPEAAEERLSIDLLALALADVLPLVGGRGAPGLADVPGPALAGLFLRHSLNAAPSMSLHGAEEVDKGGDAVAVLVVAGVYVDCALTTPAAANAVATSRTRDLNMYWFIRASYRKWRMPFGERSLTVPIDADAQNRRMLDLHVRRFLRAEADCMDTPRPGRSAC